MPDITATMRPSPIAQNDRAFAAAKSMKSGNVMGSRKLLALLYIVPRCHANLRVFAGNHMLPDVTASAGVKVASELKQESVLSILGRGKSSAVVS